MKHKSSRVLRGDNSAGETGKTGGSTAGTEARKRSCLPPPPHEPATSCTARKARDDGRSSRGCRDCAITASRSRARRARSLVPVCARVVAVADPRLCLALRPARLSPGRLLLASQERTEPRGQGRRERGRRQRQEEERKDGPPRRTFGRRKDGSLLQGGPGARTHARMPNRWDTYPPVPCSQLAYGHVQPTHTSMKENETVITHKWNGADKHELADEKVRRAAGLQEGSCLLTSPAPARRATPPTWTRRSTSSTSRATRACAPVRSRSTSLQLTASSLPSTVQPD